MADAVHSTSAPIIIPFPVDRGRPPASPPRTIGDVIAEWTRARNTLFAARMLGPTEVDATIAVRAMIAEGDACAVSRMLYQLVDAIALLRSAEAELVSAERMISAAADRVLTEAGR